jgi:hypothetical protein
LELTEIYNQSIDLSGSFLLKDNGLELTKEVFLSAVKHAIRIINKHQPYGRELAPVSISQSLKHIFVDSVLYPVPEEVPVAIPCGGLGGFFPLNYFKDRFRFEVDKQPVPITYRKPYLYVPYQAEYNITTINYYRVRQQTGILLLADYTAYELEISQNSIASSIATDLAEIINTISGFNATANDAEVTVTNSSNGAVQTIFSIGNTDWDDPVVDQVGDVSHPHIVTFTCSADVNYSLLGKYIVISTPSNTYYVWFDINDYAKDPVSTWYFVDHIDECDAIDPFFRLCVGRFKQMLGDARRSFILDNMPIKSSADSLVSDGKLEEQDAIKEIIESNHADLAW